MKRVFLGVFVATLLFGGAHAQELRIGLQDDADVLDPARTRSLASLIVLSTLCDSLIRTKTDLTFEPRLASGWAWSDAGRTLTLTLRPGLVFHDGTPLDAAAVKYNIERTRTLPDSARKVSLASVAAVEVVDPLTVRFRLSTPDAALVSQLAFTAGMMVSPKAAEELGADFGRRPVCAGPFRFVERVVQDRIVLQKFPQHPFADRISFQRLTFLPIADSTVRFANLRSGDLQLIERIAPPDVKTAQGMPTLGVAAVASYGYQGIYINVANGVRADTPLGRDRRVRQALEAAIDRDAINAVVFDGMAPPTNQPVGPSSPWYNTAFPLKPADPARARALLKEAGVATPFPVEMEVGNIPSSRQVAELLQAMWKEIGVEARITVKEFATLLKEAPQGNFQLSVRGTAGYADPDGIIATFVTCGSAINDGHYCNPQVDSLLAKARALTDPAQRKPLYDAVLATLMDDMPTIYLYQLQWLYGFSSRLKGFTPYPSAWLYLEDVTLQP